MTSDDRLLATAHAAVDVAKTIFLKPAEHEFTAKGDRDYATEADYEIERVVRKQLAEATPDIGFLGEEEGHTGSTERWWCLDPIDGTVNYAHGSPLCGISLALVEDDTPTLGVIDLPFLGNRYSARTGFGATRDGQKIRVGTVSQLEDAVATFGDFAVGEDAGSQNEIRSDIFDKLAVRALRVRMLGSAAVDLAWVADGKTDLVVIVGGHTWDIAAGKVIAFEAGALVGDTEIKSQTLTVATNPPMHAVISELLAAIGLAYT